MQHNDSKSDFRGMYELIDFGDGRKLERIAGRLVDRPSPAAESFERTLDRWPVADATFELTKAHSGTWQYADSWQKAWAFREPFGVLELAPTPFGHIGVFPEQRGNWNWLVSNSEAVAGLNLLNLFAYSGGSTLAAASAGASVTHVDSARNIVNRARSNAVRSGLDDRPVRWIVEDALRFIEREIRRGKLYDGVILDPPTYGHGVSKGQIWNIDEDLSRLIAMLADLVPRCQLMLCTCHSPGISTTVLKRIIAAQIPIPDNFESGEVSLCTADDRRLPAGVFIRWIHRHVEA